MSPEERKRMEELCRRITVEQDRETFNRLVIELNDLLEQKDLRLKLKSANLNTADRQTSG